jgi:hypothetical protein
MTPTLLLSLALVAAGDDPAAPSKHQSSNIDACALVTRAEAAALLGGLRRDPVPQTGYQQERECHYVSERGAQLSVSVYTADRWDLQKGIVSEMSPVAVPGLGDEAFAVRRGTYAEVYVRKGALLLEVRGSAGMEVSRGMAAKAAGRL